MDINTGHLIDLESMGELLKYNGKNYTPVPEKLQGEAIQKLQGYCETFIDLEDDSKLSLWAKKERNKNKAKMIKKSRKGNRK